MRRVFLATLLCCLLALGGSALATKHDPVLLVAFGTSETSALTAYSAVAASFTKNGMAPVWAYTSDIIRRKMAKAGTHLFSIDEGMDALTQKGVKKLRVQSLHIVAGEEFSQMERSVLMHLERKPGQFEEVLIGRPLLESERDLEDVVNAVLAEFPKERTATDAILLMGHGNHSGRGDLVLDAARAAFHKRDPLVYLVTVEGPGNVDAVLADLKKNGIKRVWLQPFMLVAGDHAKNDLAGAEPDSLASRLKNAGMEVVPHLKGLGELAGVRAVFLRHAAETQDNIVTIKEAN
ncbi:MAG: sirohydrochlorin cobaltochelatase [Bilophila sp.]